MTAARMRQRATYDDLVRLPENMVGELIDGELFAWPRPRGTDANAVAVFLALIGVPLVLAYTATIHWIFRGKVKLDPTSY